MAKIRHIALTTDNPRQVAECYKSAFDLEEIRESENGEVFLADGYINLARMTCKTERDADDGPIVTNCKGVEHRVCQLDSLDDPTQTQEAVNGKALNSREGLASMPGDAPRNYEMKWSGPNDVVIDVSHTGWATS